MTVGGKKIFFSFIDSLLMLGGRAGRFGPPFERRRDFDGTAQNMKNGRWEVGKALKKGIA